jgi:hypothetical protein
MIRDATSPKKERLGESRLGSVQRYRCLVPVLGAPLAMVVHRCFLSAAFALADGFLWRRKEGTPNHHPPIDPHFDII